ncbi:hypothetical protein QVD17_39053 [Tagetes erecta]|uniref:V-type proton ATPase proteolipid subunit n=1 Tax=Tagetes erecta TaxID=13708 RepID=A0AAD8JMW6_TARER|nr:hypothetical protein QVD17_39053 [Tagetes erecta]
MSSTFSGDETAPFFGFLGAAAALVFSCMGAAYGTAKSGVGVASMGVMRPELVMKSIVPVVMAGVLGIYGLIIAVIISTGINPKAKSYYLFDGYAHLSSGLACGLAGLSAGMAIGIVGDAGVRVEEKESGRKLEKICVPEFFKKISGRKGKEVERKEGDGQRYHKVIEVAAGMLNCQKGALPIYHLGVPIGLNMGRINSWGVAKEDLLKENINMDALVKGVVGDGSIIGFWYDCWALDCPLMEAFPQLFSLEINKRCKVGHRVTRRGNVISLFWEWKRRPQGVSEETQLVQLKEVIERYVFGSSCDRWVWFGDDVGVFSVKSLRNIIEYNRVPPDLNPMSWCHWIPLKVRCFAWRARLDRFPAKSALIARGVGIDGGGCSMCIGADETPSHLLISCPFASRVWEQVAAWCGVSLVGINGIKDFMEITDSEKT